VRGPSRVLARRYARALLDVVSETKADPEVVRRELREVSDLLLGNAELARVLQHPAVPVEGKKALLAALWEKTKPLPLLVRLADLLVGRGRIALLPAIADGYRDLWNERRGIIAAEALSAIELPPPQRDALVEALRRASGSAVELSARVEPEVLGGLLVRMGGKTYDGTVRGRLKALRASLVQGR